MPLGAQDEEAAHRTDLFGLGGGHFLVGGHALLEEGAGRRDGLVVGLGKAGGFGDHRVVIARLAQVSMISVPRPAMFVAMVTAPSLPAWATISASFS